jgi:hypothetical protein
VCVFLKGTATSRAGVTSVEKSFLGEGSKRESACKLMTLMLKRCFYGEVEDWKLKFKS